MPEQDDVVLQRDVRASSTTATTTEAASPSAAPEATCATPPPSKTGRSAAPGTHTCHARPAAGRLRSGRPARRHVHGAAATAAANRGVAAAIGSLGAVTATLCAATIAFGAIGRARAIAAISTSAIKRPRAVAGTIANTVATTITGAIAGARTILPRTKHLLAVAAAEIHAIGDAGLQIVVAKALLNIRIAVSNTLAMRRVVLPVVSDVAYLVVVVDVEVAVAPVASAAPVIDPASDGPARAECETRCDHGRADIRRIGEIIGRIGRVRPSSVNDCRIVVRHVDCVGVGRLDHDRLLAFLRLNADFLLLGGDQLFVVIGLGA